MPASSPISDLRPADYADLREPTSVLRGLRVCLVAGTLGQGGAERQLFYIASTLKKAGGEVRVLSLTQGEVWESRLRAIGVPVKHVGASGSRLKRLFALVKAVGEFRPNIVQSQHFFMNGYGAIAARLRRAKAVGAVRSSGLADARDCGAMFAKVCLHGPHVLAANSRAAIRALLAMGCPERKLHYLQNVIDSEQFRPADHANDGPPMILGIGRLGPEKRFDRFLRILALLKQSSAASFGALIAGDGPLRPELDRLAHNLGLRPDTVQFCGNVSSVQAIYHQADILLLTSDHEGTPNVVMEAMSSGLPVVATAVGDVPELVQDGDTGYVVDTADELAAVGHLSKLLNNSNQRKWMGNRGREFIQAHYALGSLAGHLSRLFFPDAV